MRGVTCPEVFQSGTMPLVVLAMHEFGRHEDFISVGEAPHTREISGIMVSVQFVEISPGVDDVAALRVVSAEQAVDGGVPSALVAIAPKHDAGVVDVTRQHFADKFCPGRGVVGILPAGKLVDVKQSQ